MSILNQEFEIQTQDDITKISFTFKNINVDRHQLIEILNKTNNQLKKALINPKLSKFKQLTLWQKY